MIEVIICQDYFESKSLNEINEDLKRAGIKFNKFTQREYDVKNLRIIYRQLDAISSYENALESFFEKFLPLTPQLKELEPGWDTMQWYN